MDDKKAQNIKTPDIRNGNGSKWHPLATAILGAVLGSGSGVALVFNTPIGENLARPNPYTSVDAKIYETKTDARLRVCEQHILEHPDRRGNFDARINENKYQIGMQAVILTNIGEAVNKNSVKLDKLLERK